MIRSLFFFFLLLYDPLSILAQVTLSPEGWSTETMYPSGGVDDGACFSLGEKFYAGGGLDASFSVRRDWHVYDPKTRTWESAGDIPGEGMQYAASISDQHYGYLFGGILSGGRFSNACYRFGGAPGEWKVMDTPPWEPRGASTVFSIGRDIYIAGGRNDSLFFDDLWRYAPQTGTWSRMNDLPFPGGRDEMVSFGYSNYAYVIMGRMNGKGVKEVWRYNAINDSWKQLDDYPGKSVAYAAAVETSYGGIVSGGEDAIGEILSETYYFDATLEEWRQIEVVPFTPMRGFGLAAVGDTILSYGGLGEDNVRHQGVEILILNEKRTYEEMPSLVVSPNPAKVEIRVLWTWAADHSVRYSVFDLKGRLVEQVILSAGSDYYIHDISSYSPGIYLLLAESEGGEQIRKLIVLP